LRTFFDFGWSRRSKLCRRVVAPPVAAPWRLSAFAHPGGMKSLQPRQTGHRPVFHAENISAWNQESKPLHRDHAPLRRASCDVGCGLPLLLKNSFINRGRTRQRYRMRLLVFLVEDNKTISDNLIATLEELVGAEVVKLVDGEEDARVWLQAHKDWSLAVIDLFIKEGSGLGVLAALQARRPTQRAVILSNYATREMRHRCAALGLTKFSTSRRSWTCFLITASS